MWLTRPKLDIAKLKQNKDISGMIQALGHRDWLIRRDAARALGELKDPEAMTSLSLCLLRDGYWLVRWSAAMALLQIGDRRACSSLAFSMKRDPDRHVRLAAKDALLELEKMNRPNIVEPVGNLDEARPGMGQPAISEPVAG